MNDYYSMTIIVCSICKEPSNSCCRECTIKGIVLLALSIVCIISLIFWILNTWKTQLSLYILAIVFFVAMIRYLIGATLKIEKQREREYTKKGYNIEFEKQ
ncbi:unnamed protein product [Paramecium pentaurelia]|uniref:Uncharacterized protein n=1 Tax=Paramecium pentaurelia TaxID=43138 RepID=A0A8S1XTN3_9CILI|nr:unnamed protein product [Paramecium pentaurelia]